MRITTQGSYGLVCVLTIARNAGRQPVSIQAISEKEQLSIDYLEQLLLKLRRAGIVKSLRGRMGGYLLAKPASRLTVKDVIEAVEGSVFDTICDHKKRKKDTCIRPRDCFAKPMWTGLKGIIEDYLGKVSIASLLNSKATNCHYRKK